MTARLQELSTIYTPEHPGACQDAISTPVQRRSHAALALRCTSDTPSCPEALGMEKQLEKIYHLSEGTHLGVRPPFPPSRQPDARMVHTGSFPGTEPRSLFAADDLDYVLKVSLIFV